MVNLGETPSGEGLVDLLAACHARARRFAQLAVTLGEGAPGSPAELADAARACRRYFAEALPLHAADEDVTVTPLLQGRSAAVDDALETMRAQHLEHHVPLESLDGALAAFALTPGEAGARTRLLLAARTVATALRGHMDLEEAVIFPALRAQLSPGDDAAAVAALRARRLPTSNRS